MPHQPSMFQHTHPKKVQLLPNPVHESHASCHLNSLHCIGKMAGGLMACRSWSQPSCPLKSVLTITQLCAFSQNWANPVCDCERVLVPMISGSVLHRFRRIFEAKSMIGGLGCCGIRCLHFPHSFNSDNAPLRIESRDFRAVMCGEPSRVGEGAAKAPPTASSASPPPWNHKIAAFDVV